MKRIFASGVIALGLANAAQAGLLITSSRASVSVGNGTFDRITFTLSGLNGSDTQTGPSGQAASIILVKGTFSAVGSGSVLAVPGDDTSTDDGYWENFITSARGGQHDARLDLSGGASFSDTGIGGIAGIIVDQLNVSGQSNLTVDF